MLPFADRGSNSTRGEAASCLRRGGPWLPALVLSLVAAPAVALDWAKASATEVALFYPGQQSWEKTLTAKEHKGAAKIRAGEGCGGECHGGEEADMGATMAEAAGFRGRSSAVVQVKAAVVGDAIHWQISGPLAGGPPGVALMLGTDAIKSTTQAGCWAACHDDAPGMASDAGKDLGKYLSGSRTRNTATGGGDSVKPAADLAAALASGSFLELIEVAPDGATERGHVLDRFHEKAVAGGASPVKVEGGRWVAEIVRPLAAAGPGEIALQEGRTYYVGVAIHDPGVEGHEHLVSLVRTLVIGSGSADIVAARQ